MAIFSAQGTTLTIDVSGTPTAIGQLTSYSGFDGEAPDLQTTTFADTEFHTFRQGLMDHGGFSLDVFRDPTDAGQLALEAAANALETREFVLTIDGWGTVTFNAYVKAMPIAGGIDAFNTSSIPLKITGEPDWQEA